MRSTHAYTILEISPEAHAEIKAKLLAAGYSHAIDGETIDMHGIAIRSELEPEGVHHCSCSAVERCDINVHPDSATHRALSDLVVAISAYDERIGASSRVTVHSDVSGGSFHSHTFNAREMPPFKNVKREGDKITGGITVEWPDPAQWNRHVETGKDRFGNTFDPDSHPLRQPREAPSSRRNS